MPERCPHCGKAHYPGRNPPPDPVGWGGFLIALFWLVTLVGLAVLIAVNGEGWWHRFAEAVVKEASR